MQDIPVMDCGDGRQRAQSGVVPQPYPRTALDSSGVTHYVMPDGNDLNSAYTIRHGDAGLTFTNAGASGAVTYTLPQSNLYTNPPRRITGMRFRFVKYANQTLTITAPAAATVTVNGVSVSLPAAKINNGSAGGTYANTTSSASSWPLADVEAISETEWVANPGVGTWAP